MVPSRAGRVFLVKILMLRGLTARTPRRFHFPGRDTVECCGRGRDLAQCPLLYRAGTPYIDGIFLSSARSHEWWLDTVSVTAGDTVDYSTCSGCPGTVGSDDAEYTV